MTTPTRKRMIKFLKAFLHIVQFSSFARTISGMKSADVAQLQIDIENLKNETD